MLASIAMFALVSGSMSDADFLSWGWRIPFLLSFVLVGIGLWIRMSLAETPAFQRVLAGAQVKRAPLMVVLTRHRRMFFTAIALKVSEIAWAVIGTVFSIVYVTGKLGMPRSTILTAIQIAAFLQMVINAVLWLAVRPAGAQAAIYLCLPVLDRVRLSGLLAAGYQGPGADHLRHQRRRGGGAGRDVRRGGDLHVRVVRDQRAL